MPATHVDHSLTTRSTDGELLAIIDWGDAGWGDPTLDFAAIPFDAVRPTLEGYEAEAPGALGPFPEARIAWNKLIDSLDGLRPSDAAVWSHHHEGGATGIAMSRGGSRRQM